MSLFALQLDVGATSVFLFEKAVALRSYWLSQGVAGPGWGALVSTVNELQVTPTAARRANKRVKTLQAQTRKIGDWVMGVRKGDMVAVLNEHEATWSVLAVLLPITAVLGSQDAADVLVSLSTCNDPTDSLANLGTLVPHGASTSEEDKPMDFDTAHNIITAAAAYVGAGYEMREFSNTLRAVLQAFDGPAAVRIAEACKWRPPARDIVTLLRNISAAQTDREAHIVVSTDKGIDVLTWLAAGLFDCKVSVSVDGRTEVVVRGQGPDVLIAVLPTGQRRAAGTYNFANARLGVGPQGQDAGKDDKQWEIVETRWVLSDYIHLRFSAWALDTDACSAFIDHIADKVLTFWFHSRVHGSLGGDFSEGLRSAIVDHKRSEEPAPGTPLKDLFATDTFVERIRAFDSRLADVLANRAGTPETPPYWATRPCTWASPDLAIFAPYCPCVKHKGTKASPSVIGQGCIVQHIHSLSQFASQALRTLLFLTAPAPTTSGGSVPLNCGAAARKLVARLPGGMHRGEQLDLSHILEAAVLLLGTTALASQAAARDVIGLAAFGVSVIPNALVTTSTSPAENLSFTAAPGALWCRGVSVGSVRNASWANTGFLGLGGPPVGKEKVHVVPADDALLHGPLESASSARSEVRVEASLMDGAGYVAFRVGWTLDGEEVAEYISPCDVFYGMSGVPLSHCTGEHASDEERGGLVMMCSAAGSTLNKLDHWNYPKYSYAREKGIEVVDCLGKFDGLVAAGMRDRGHLLRALRYHYYKVRLGDGCLECAVKYAVKEKCEMVIVE